MFVIQNRKNRIVIAGLLFLLTLNSLFAAEGAVTRRFGIFIGSNNGGRDRVQLRYAVSDARSMSRIFSSMGGISQTDNIILVEPAMAEVNRQLENLGKLSALSRRNKQRTELVFYFSGHSDETGLLLNRERYSYQELRERINKAQFDMKIVILDSCSSGAITRAKGGTKTQPFLFDSSVSAEGYAILTSSSADEVSQESDRIRSSYFTHSLLAGLRGAADSVGDGRVTLNELYRYAYTETLAKTETSLYGLQHPSYDIQISGSGDVVLTDIKEISAGIIFSEELTGRISIRDSSDFLVAELTKVTRKPLELGLEPGLYRIILQRGDNFYRAEITLTENQRTTLGMKNFTAVNATSGNRTRGDNSDSDDNPDSDGERTNPEKENGNSLYSFFVNIVDEDFRYPLIGFVNIAKGNFNNTEIGFVNWNNKNMTGFQIGYINTVWGGLSGIQIGFVNTTAGDTRGWQGGFVNTTRTLEGVQIGYVNTAWNGGSGFQIGYVNTSVKKLRGMQIGFFNYAESIEGGIPIGFLSILKEGGYYAIECSVSEFFPFNAAFKVGVEKFYTNIITACNPFEDFGTKSLAFGLGFGSIIPITEKIFFNPELNFLNPFLWNDTIEWYDNRILLSLVPSLGFNFNRNFSVFAGPSVAWIFDNSEENSMKPSFSAFNREIDSRNSITVGARAGIRFRF